MESIGERGGLLLEDVKGEKKGEKGAGGGRISMGQRPKEHSLWLLCVEDIYLGSRLGNPLLWFELPCCDAH